MKKRKLEINEENVRLDKFVMQEMPDLSRTLIQEYIKEGHILVNGKNETYGFPSKIEDDPILSFVIKGDNSIDYAEERRLFYVAMTRTKNRVYFMNQEDLIQSAKITDDSGKRLSFQSYEAALNDSGVVVPTSDTQMILEDE